jgi:hypothetical protein
MGKNMNWQQVLKAKRTGKIAVRGRAKRAIVEFLHTLDVGDEFQNKDILGVVEDTEGVTVAILGQQLKHLVDSKNLERTYDTVTGIATYKYLRVYPPSEKER